MTSSCKAPVSIFVSQYGDMPRTYRSRVSNCKQSIFVILNLIWGISSWYYITSFHLLIYWGLNEMADISQTIFSNGFLSTNIIVWINISMSELIGRHLTGDILMQFLERNVLYFDEKSPRVCILRVQLGMSQHRYMYWPGVEQATVYLHCYLRIILLCYFWSWTTSQGDIFGLAICGHSTVSW